MLAHDVPIAPTVTVAVLNAPEAIGRRKRVGDLTRRRMRGRENKVYTTAKKRKRRGKERRR